MKNKARNKKPSQPGPFRVRINEVIAGRLQELGELTGIPARMLVLQEAMATYDLLIRHLVNGGEIRLEFPDEPEREVYFRTRSIQRLRGEIDNPEGSHLVEVGI